jgi:hypothetical protein
MLHITFLSHLFQPPPMAGLGGSFNHQFSEFWGGTDTPIGQNDIYLVLDFFYYYYFYDFFF